MALIFTQEITKNLCFINGEFVSNCSKTKSVKVKQKITSFYNNFTTIKKKATRNNLRKVEYKQKGRARFKIKCNYNWWSILVQYFKQVHKFD